VVEVANVLDLRESPENALRKRNGEWAKRRTGEGNVGPNANRRYAHSPIAVSLFTNPGLKPWAMIYSHFVARTCRYRVWLFSGHNPVVGRVVLETPNSFWARHDIEIIGLVAVRNHNGMVASRDENDIAIFDRHGFINVA
jgi:hypothetical protein